MTKLGQLWGGGYRVRESSLADAEAYKDFRIELEIEQRERGRQDGLGIPAAGDVCSFTIDYRGSPVGVVAFRDEYLNMIFVVQAHRRTGAATIAVAVLIQRHFDRAHHAVQAEARTPEGRHLLRRLGFADDGILERKRWERCKLSLTSADSREA